jgi:hypothetical protein
MNQWLADLLPGACRAIVVNPTLPRQEDLEAHPGCLVGDSTLAYPATRNICLQKDVTPHGRRRVIQMSNTSAADEF